MKLKRFNENFNQQESDNLEYKSSKHWYLNLLDELQKNKGNEFNILKKEKKEFENSLYTDKKLDQNDFNQDSKMAKILIERIKMLDNMISILVD